MREMSQLERVLNNITGTSIFVTSKDNNEILYVNKRIKKIKPEIKPGDICEEVWKCEHKNCPACSMEGEGSRTITSYDMPFGKFVDISATEIMWEDRIPAYLVSVSNHLLDEIDQGQELGRRQMQIAVAQIYTMVISVNLTKNTYFMIEYTDFDSHCAPASGNFNELIIRGADSMHPDYKEAFFDNFNRDSLLELYEKGEKSRYMEHRQMGDDGIYHWTDTHVIRIENPYNQDVLQISLSRNIDERKQMEEQVKQVLCQREEVSKRFAISIRSIYDDIYEVDLIREDVYNFRYEDTGLAKVLMEQSYTALTQEMAEQVCEVHRERYLERVSIDTLKRQLQEKKGQVYFEYQRKMPDGECHWYSSLIQLISEEKSDLRVMIFERNIDGVKRKDEKKKQELQEALENAKRADRAKSEFISRMSHDIRTPINAIVGMANIASSHLEKPKKVSDCLSKIDISTRFLVSMINDILDMSKIESGNLVMEEREFWLQNVIQGISAMVMQQVEQKRQTLHISVDDSTAETYIGDELRLSQIILNLLNNAVQYTGEEGRIALVVTQTEPENDRTMLQIQVKDNGIGMSEEFQKVLFEPFEQEKSTEGRVFEGSGLGLSITRNLVHLMGGTIRFKSQKEKGSTFFIELPLKLPKENAPRENAENNSGKMQEFQGEHVLVVEDNDINLEIVQTILEGWNLTVDSAENGLVAVEKFKNSEPGWYRLILMDIRMPIMDGITATKEIRALERTDAASVPIMALTANKLQGDSNYTKSIGLDEYLTKPIEIKLLYRKIKEFIPTGSEKSTCV